MGLGLKQGCLTQSSSKLPEQIANVSIVNASIANSSIEFEIITFANLARLKEI